MMWSSFCLATSSVESGGPSTSGLYGGRGGKNFEDRDTGADIAGYDIYDNPAAGRACASASGLATSVFTLQLHND